MSENGTQIFFLHDEGALYLKSDYDSAVRRIYPEEYFSLPFVQKVFFWGDRQRSVFSDFSDHNCKLEVVGAPRLDLCRSEYSWIDEKTVGTLKSKYGDYILVCSRFAAMNTVKEDPGPLSKRAYQIRREGGDKRDKNAVLKFMFEAWSKSAYEYSHFVPLVAYLAIDFPDINFVIRPHPAENDDFYKESFCHFDNVFVEKGGDVRPVIRAAKAVIHSECTTGIEAEISGVPNINFRPSLGMLEYEHFSVAGVSEADDGVSDYLALKDWLRKLFLNGFSHYRGSGHVDDFICNVSGSRQASDLIVSSIKNYVLKEAVDSSICNLKYKFSFVRQALRPKELLRGIGGKLNRFFQVVSMRKRKDNDLENSKAYCFSEGYILSLWESFGGDPQSINISGGVVYTYPEKSSATVAEGK
tara:strand:- start:25588 stop:26826 length:1239 start_codon:yes stop_codon:yes gene_type:complete